jgi:hypothetical protein
LNKNNSSLHDLVEDGKYVILCHIELEQKVEGSRGKYKGKIRPGTRCEVSEGKQKYSSTLPSTLASARYDQKYILFFMLTF